jgi:hypothetical protein
MIGCRIFLGKVIYPVAARDSQKRFFLNISGIKPEAVQICTWWDK